MDTPESKSTLGPTSQNPNPGAPPNPKDKQTLLRYFIVLRANGWSLSHISFRLNVPKSTLYDWNTKHQADINTMKFMRMEQIHSANAPSYQEELGRLASYLNRVEAVLADRNFEDLSTPTLFYFGLHLRSRFHRLRKEAGLHAADASSFNGCVSNREHVLSAEALADLPPELSLPSENPLRTNPDEIGGIPNLAPSASMTCEPPSGQPSGSQT